MTISREKLLLRQIAKVKAQLTALDDLRPHFREMLVEPCPVVVVDGIAPL